eukprot:TRINITY_DN32018_c0_g1_i1.p1 TRINITY_DN32018_c0_g1~~TRINITY_DN32018_c0_g1_i1.p1  ORF type:complete len:362 (-),score=32.62 TRINITY_DN32018_c0_g1_i1:169-1254(-)
MNSIRGLDTAVATRFAKLRSAQGSLRNAMANVSKAKYTHDHVSKVLYDLRSFYSFESRNDFIGWIAYARQHARWQLLRTMLDGVQSQAFSAQQTDWLDAMRKPMPAPAAVSSPRVPGPTMAARLPAQTLASSLSPAPARTAPVSALASPLAAAAARTASASLSPATSLPLAPARMLVSTQPSPARAASLNPAASLPLAPAHTSPVSALASPSAPVPARTPTLSPAASAAISKPVTAGAVVNPMTAIVGEWYPTVVPRPGGVLVQIPAVSLTWPPSYVVMTKAGVFLGTIQVVSQAAATSLLLTTTLGTNIVGTPAADWSSIRWTDGEVWTRTAPAPVAKPEPVKTPTPTSNGSRIVINLED